MKNTPQQQTSRMHSVPASYLAAFAVPAPDRRTPAVWRFGRERSSKLVGIYDAEVVRDIYTVFNEDGTPDTAIEDDFLKNIDDAFSAVREVLKAGSDLTPLHFASLARFIALELMRTPGRCR